MTRNDRRRRARWGSLVMGMALLAVAPLAVAAPAGKAFAAWLKQATERRNAG